MKKFLEYVDIGPRTHLKKGEVYDYIEMKQVEPFMRKPSIVVKKKYTGQGCIFQEGDILLARITPSLEHGKAVFVRKLDTKVGFGSTEFFVLRTKNKKIDQLYLYYFCFEPIFRETLINSMIGASGRQRVNKGVFYDYEFDPPSLSTQHKIASILSAYDDLIELNERRIKILEEMARLIYKEWFVKFRFPGYEKVRIVKSEMGKIPEGWEVRRLSDFIDFIKGSEPGSKNYYEEKQANSIRFIRVGNLLNLSKDFIYIDKFLAKTEIEENDVLISLDGTVGKVDYGIRGAIASGIRKCCSKIGKMYQYQLLKSPRLQGYLTGVSSGGTVLAHAGNHIKNYLVATSKDLYLEVEYSELCDPLFEECVNLKGQNSILRQTRDMLLPKLISGEIDVSGLEIKIR